MVVVAVKVYRCVLCGRECLMRFRSHPIEEIEKFEKIFTDMKTFNPSNQCALFGGYSHFELMYEEKEEM